MPIPKAPNLWWSIAAYYALLFVAGVAIQSDTSHEHGLSDLIKDGLLLPILGTMGFVAPIVEGDWVSWVLVIFVICGLILAVVRLRGWVRWGTVMSLIVCITVYGLYLAVRAGA